MLRADEVDSYEQALLQQGGWCFDYVIRGLTSATYECGSDKNKLNPSSTATTFDV
jgi:hypothetical protein